jgi:hypothetical protein
MRKRTRKGWRTLAVVMIASIGAISQEQSRTLVVSGHAGSVPVTQSNGRSYVDLEALAQVVNGALSFNGNQITLTLSPAGGTAMSAQSPTAAASSGTNNQFSKAFLQAGIEEMSTIREWHSTLTSAIENQYPFTQVGLSRYQAQASTNLRLMQAAATTDADQNAAQLVANEYQKMKQLSDKYLAKRENMNYISPDALTNDSLNQSIMACGKSLGAMAASGQFVDDGTCH